MRSGRKKTVYVGKKAQLAEAAAAAADLTAVVEGAEEKNAYRIVNARDLWAMLEEKYRPQVTEHDGVLQDAEAPVAKSSRVATRAEDENFIKKLRRTLPKAVEKKQTASGIRMGCACKSGCRKIGRCACLMAGRSCSEFCRCFMCENSKECGSEATAPPTPPNIRTQIYCLCKRGCKHLYCMCRKYNVPCGPLCHPFPEETVAACCNLSRAVSFSIFLGACNM